MMVTDENLARVDVSLFLLFIHSSIHLISYPFISPLPVKERFGVYRFAGLRLLVRQSRCNPGFRVQAICPTRVSPIRYNFRIEP